MTENQEKEVFLLLNNIVTQVQSVQSDVKEIKQTVNEHSQILNGHSRILDEHSRILNRLDAKTDSIADKVITNDKRLTAVEKNATDLRSEIQ